MKTYSMILRIFAITTVVCFAYLIVMSDYNEDREPFEFVPIQTK